MCQKTSCSGDSLLPVARSLSAHLVMEGDLRASIAAKVQDGHFARRTSCPSAQGRFILAAYPDLT
jgi:hypothetical protein